MIIYKAPYFTARCSWRKGSSRDFLKFYWNWSMWPMPRLLLDPFPESMSILKNLHDLWISLSFMLQQSHMPIRWSAQCDLLQRWASLSKLFEQVEHRDRWTGYFSAGKAASYATQIAMDFISRISTLRCSTIACIFWVWRGRVNGAKKLSLQGIQLPRLQWLSWF